MKKLLLCLIILHYGLCHKAQVSNPISEDLQDVLDARQGDNALPGISAAVLVHEVGIWKGVSGVSFGAVKMNSNMLLGIASNTKLFTAVLCLKLVEQGVISMEDPLSKWLPNYANIDPSITVRQLLHHQSGIHDYTETPNFFDSVIKGANVFWEPNRILSLVQAPLFEPGSRTQYSNTNYILAGLILEAATKSSYRQLVRDSILTPLNLSNTYLEGLESVPSRLAHPWWQGTDYSNTSRKALGSISWASGCMVSTPEDMVKWYDAVFNQGFLSDEGIDELKNFVPAVRVPYQLGISLLEVPYFGRKYWGFAGKTLGFNSFFLYDPESKHAVAVMVNDTKNKAETVAKDLIKRIHELTSLVSSNKDKRPIDLEWSVFPNPTKDYLQVELNFPSSDFISLTMFDSQGKRLFEILDYSLARNQLPLPNYSQGIYNLILRTQQGFQTQKIMLH